MAIHETAHIVAAAVQKRILVSVRITALGLNAVIKEKHDVDANRFLINISGPCANILMFFICIIIKTYYFNAGYNMRFLSMPIYVLLYLTCFRFCLWTAEGF